MADRNRIAVLEHALQKKTQEHHAALNQLMTVLVEHHEGQVEISVPVFQKIITTPLQAKPDLNGNTLKITVCDPQGREAIARDTRFPKLTIDKGRKLYIALGGLIEALHAGDKNEIADAIALAAAVLDKIGEDAPLVVAPAMPAAEPEATPEAPVERCSECGWAFGEHRPGCSIAAAVAS